MLLSHRRQISRASLDVLHQKCSRSDGTVFPLARAKPQEAFFALDHHVEQIPQRRHRKQKALTNSNVPSATAAPSCSV
jgi:hypothetical protein